MKMKKFLSFLLIAMLMMSFLSISMAEEMPEIGNSKIDSTGKLGGFALNLLKTLQYIGYAIAIGWTLYMGIKYIMASADEKASLKGGMVKMLIGVILIAAASTIVGALVDAKMFG